MDGRSMAPILAGETQAGREHVFTHMTSTVTHAMYPSRCVRTKNSSYIFNTWSNGKLAFRNESMAGLTFNAMKEEAAKDPVLEARVEMFLHRRREEFYDLRSDPHERRDRFADPACKHEIGRLKELLMTQMRAKKGSADEGFSGGLLGGGALEFVERTEAENLRQFVQGGVAFSQQLGVTKITGIESLAVVTLNPGRELFIKRIRQEQRRVRSGEIDPGSARCGGAGRLARRHFACFDGHRRNEPVAPACRVREFVGFRPRRTDCCGIQRER